MIERAGTTPDEVSPAVAQRFGSLAPNPGGDGLPDPQALSRVREPGRVFGAMETKTIAVPAECQDRMSPFNPRTTCGGFGTETKRHSGGIHDGSPWGRDCLAPRSIASSNFSEFALWVYLDPRQIGSSNFPSFQNSET